MSKPVVMGEEAERELSAAVDWYQEQAGLGADLLVAVRAAGARIARRPTAFPLVPGVSPRLGVRRCVMTSFPYALRFIELLGQLHIIAFAHLKRRPGYWRARVQR